MNSAAPPYSESLVWLIRAALEEDLGAVGDLTSSLVSQPYEPVSAAVMIRAAGIYCGGPIAALVCEEYRGCGGEARYAATLRPDGAPQFAEGARVGPGDCVAHVCGRRADVLSVERTVLNFLTRMSGVATLTRRYVDAAAAANPQARVLDTRKTIPGWRELDKYAVRCGGGLSHRMGLFDAVLIKDNHLAGVAVEQLAGALREMIARLRAGTLRPEFVEVEVETLAQLDVVLGVDGVDYVLLDNFPVERLRRAVSMRDERGRRGAVLLEASGGVTLESIASIAATGVDRISVGAITHSAPALDIALDL